MKKSVIFELSLAFALIICIGISAYGANLESRIKDTTLRLHVLANSDEDFDQALKLKVRDAVLKVWESSLTASNANEAKALARENTALLEKAAKDEIEKNGFDYDVEVEVKTEHFLTRDYGAFVLPAGDYDAVIVKIGSGGGKNWWCVMFPPLCAGASNEEIVAYYGENAGKDVAFIIGGEKTRVTLKLKSVEVIRSLIEKINSL